MFGIVRKKELSAFKEELIDEISEIMGERTEKNGNLQSYEKGVMDSILHETDPERLAELEQAWKIKRRMLNKLKLAKKMRFNDLRTTRAKDDDEDEEEDEFDEDMSEEDKIKLLSQKTDWIKGIWGGVPGIVKTWINNKAKNYLPEGKTVDDLINNSDMLQEVLKSAIPPKTEPKKTTLGGLLPIEMPYNPQNPP